MLQIQTLILLNESETREFDKNRRHTIHSASSEELLAFKLELVATLGILELHASPSNNVAAWYAQKLAGLLTMVQDDIDHRTKEWK